MVTYICIKVQENISNTEHFQVTEGTQIYYRNYYFQSSKGHNSKSRLIRVTVLVFCTLIYNALHLCEVSSNVWNGFQPAERTRVHSRNGYFQYLLCSKDHSKNRLSGVMFFFSACYLMILYICEKLHNNIERTHSRNGYFQYLICSKDRNSKSRLTRVTYVLVCVLHVILWCFTFVKKFHNNISHGFQLSERTRVQGRNNDYVQCSKGNSSKSRETKVTIHVFCTSSHSALHLSRYQTWSGHA